MYFKKLDHVTYNVLDDQSSGKMTVNILNSILVKYHHATQTTLYFYHTIADGDSPEILAHQYYGNPYYHWVILMMNTIVDPWYQWALDAQQMQALLTSRYGAGNEGALNHLVDLSNNRKRLDEVAQADAQDFFDTNGYWPVNISPVSNQEYENKLNDDRRTVKVLRQKYLRDFVSQFNKLMNRDTLV